MKNAVAKAIRLLGPTLFEAAVRTGIQPTTLWKWKRAGRIKDGRRAVEISRLTGGRVTIEDLVGAPPVSSPNGDNVEGRKLSVTSPAGAPAWSDSPATEPPTPLTATLAA